MTSAFATFYTDSGISSLRVFNGEDDREGTAMYGKDAAAYLSAHASEFEAMRCKVSWDGANMGSYIMFWDPK